MLGPSSRMALLAPGVAASHTSTTVMSQGCRMTLPAAAATAAAGSSVLRPRRLRRSLAPPLHADGRPDVPAPASNEELTGIVFQPFKDVLGQVESLDRIIDSAGVPGPTTMSAVSLARHDYEDRLEAAINEQINVEYNMSYVYHSLAAFMDRDNVGLPGFAAYFKHNSDDERHHANLLMVQQNRRGGRVKLQTVLTPESEFTNEVRGEALWLLELALALEKLNFGKLRELHSVAEAANDAEMQHFLEDYLLHQQAKDVKEVADLVSRARRAGPGHGTFHLDLVLQRQYGYGLAREDAGAADGVAAAIAG